MMMSSPSPSPSNTISSSGGVRQRQLTSRRPPFYAPSGSALYGPTNPVNYVYISQGGIKGSFTVDCDFHTPEFLRAPLRPSERIRKNLDLHACSGGIDVEIMIVGSLNNQKRVSLAASVGDSRASINVKVVRGSVSSAFSFVLPFLQVSSTVPFYLEVRAPKGIATVSLPRSFHGLLRTCGPAGNDVSAVSEHLT